MRADNTEPKLDLSKPVQTRDGRKARIICTDRKGHGHFDSLTIVALVKYDDAEVVHVYRQDGKSIDEGERSFDLINVPAKHVRWVNFYPHPHAPCEHATREAADYAALKARIACVKVEFAEGEGL